MMQPILSLRPEQAHKQVLTRERRRLKSTAPFSKPARKAEL